ncbi:hypothetical protein [Ectothiorhodospira mobilis]|uniref:hypothetical protein n=1 Tax=Ectothiorhodospira mobilis TaxID=195064 RepID=UPI00237926D7|nr:hypothetical protein [Ectothiorhodospira mobilis]
MLSILHQNTHFLAQTQARGYADKYRASGKPMHLIGVAFSREQRQIVTFEVETQQPPA